METWTESGGHVEEGSMDRAELDDPAIAKVLLRFDL